MSARVCPGDGRTFHKGKRVGVVQEDGSIIAQLVCLDCYRRAVRLVRPIGGAANLCTICRAVPARICSECAARARAELVAPILAQLAGLAKAAHLNGQPERGDAIENAAHALAQEAARSATRDGGKS